MAESVSVRCPACRREHSYTPPVYPCACGAPVALPVCRDGTPVPVEHRTWAGSWVRVRCDSCGTEEEWPRPELGCVCGATLHLPVGAAPRAAEPERAGLAQEGPDLERPGLEPDLGADPAPELGRDPELPGAEGLTAEARKPEGPGAEGRKPEGPRREGLSAEVAHRGMGEREQAAVRPASPSPKPRPAFEPVTIRTAQDARTAAAQYLRWLGFPAVRMTAKSPASGVDVRGPGVVGHVDPTTSPTRLRDIETLWLNGLNETAVAVCFSLAGYTQDARTRADALGVPLFVLDLTGTPQPVNEPADELLRS